MSATKLDTPFLDGGLRATNFFNGRILSREDMQREQDAERAIHERLGVALGDGIVRGLEVEAKAIGGSSIADPVVTVRAGLALNRRGQTVALDRDVDVSLKKATAPQTSGTALAGGFDDCQPREDTVYVVGTGVYLLTVAPACVKQGLALVSGLNNGTASCNVKEIVEGVQFRLFKVTALSGAELADGARLRNVAAYKFFFAEGVATEAARDPFGVAAAATKLTDVPLTDCDVPLAVFNWTNLGGLRWVDPWAVRRRLAAPGGLASLLPVPRLAATGEAMLRQFDEQVQSMRATGALAARASDTFRWLPPAGLLPLGGLRDTAGFDPAIFFTGFTLREPLFMEGVRVAPLLRLATSFPPIEVGDPELVWRYLVRENRQPVAGLSAAHPYLVFALGRLPCQVVPRFDVSRWDHANYALDNELAGL